MKRINPESPIEEQVKFLYQNLRPEIKKKVKKVECRTVEEYLHLAVEAKFNLDEKVDLRPSAEKSLIPETASAPKNTKLPLLHLV